MGRPKKNGLDYFPLDVDFFRDIRVRRLKRKCGDSATLVYIALLTLIYNEGCYIELNDDTAFTISEDVGFTEEFISEVIVACVELGLFSKKIYTEHRALTSQAIQRRYLFIKDGDVQRIDKYCLVSQKTADSLRSNNKPADKPAPQKPVVSGGKTRVSPPKTPVSSPETPVSPPKSAQSKVKESKVKKSKEKDNKLSSSKSTAVAVADDGDAKASLTFSTASPLFPYTEPADRVDLRSELSPYVPDYDNHASEVDRLTQCGNSKNENTESLHRWAQWQAYCAKGGKIDFKLGSFEDYLRRCRARSDKGEVPDIIPYQQWEALKWLGNSSQYTTTRRNRRFVVERTAQSWDTLAEMTETIASARANPATKPFAIAAIIYAYAKKNLRPPEPPEPPDSA